MKRLACVSSVLALVGGAALALLPREAAAKDPTVKEIMGKLHKGASAPLGLVKRDLQDDNPNWPEIQRLTHEFVVLGAALGKNPPPKGDKDSWAKLARQYFDDAKAMDDAAQRKDKAGSLAAQGRLAGSCAACHKAHRPE
jgi:cytochrome c553